MQTSVESSRIKPWDILDTVDEFSSAVPFGRNREVLIYRRHHGGRTWVRLWTWNRHRRKGVWYPTKRIFLVPFDHAAALADAIRAAADGASADKPDWLIEWGHDVVTTESQA